MGRGDPTLLAARTNIEIDDDLIAEAMKVGPYPTKKAAVEAGLRRLVRLGRQRRLLELRGTVDWQGDLDAMREGWSAPPRRDEDGGPDAGGAARTREG